MSQTQCSAPHHKYKQTTDLNNALRLEGKKRQKTDFNNELRLAIAKQRVKMKGINFTDLIFYNRYFFLLNDFFNISFPDN